MNCDSVSCNKLTTHNNFRNKYSTQFIHRLKSQGFLAEELKEEQKAILERKGREASMIADLNFDSLDAVDIVMDFEEAYQIKIPDEVSEKFVNLGNVIDYIKANGYDSSKHQHYEYKLAGLHKTKV